MEEKENNHEKDVQNRSRPRKLCKQDGRGCKTPPVKDATVNFMTPDDR